MRLRKAVWKAVVLVPIACLGQATTQTGTRPATLGQEIESILGIDHPGAGPLPALVAVMQAFGRGGPEAEGAVQRLVKILNAGPKPTALSDVLVPVTSIDDPMRAQKGKDWRYGSYVDRFDLAKYLWKRAQALKGTSPVGAREMARAALVLAGLEEFHIGSALVQGILKDPLAFAEVAQLDEHQQASLQKLMEQAKATDKSFSDAYFAAAAVIDELIAGVPAEQLPAKVTESLRRVRQAEVAAEADATFQFETARLAWAALNLARAAHDKTARTAAETYVKEWAASLAEASPLRRWLTEATQRTGPPPATPFIEKPDATSAKPAGATGVR